MSVKPAVVSPDIASPRTVAGLSRPFRGLALRLVGVIRRPATSSAATPVLLFRLLRLVAITVAVAGAAAPVVTARWQLLDDGLIVDGALARFDSPINQQFREMGRNFYPAGLYFEAQRQVFGSWVRGYYVVQGAVFLATCLLIYIVVRRVTASSAMAPVAVILFAVASPVPEVTNTLYKFEIRLTLFWIATCLITVRFLESLAPGSRRPHWASLLLAGATVYAGYFLGKETISALPLVSGAVGVLGLVLARRGQRRYAVGLLSVAAVIAAAVFSAMKTNQFVGVRPVSQGSYTSGNFRLLTDQLPSRLEVFFIAVPDVLLVTGAVTVLGAVALVVRGRRFGPWEAATGIAVLSSVTLLAFNVLLWGMIQVYYNYPVSAFGALAAGLLIPMLGRVEARAVRWPAVGLGVTAVIVVLIASVPLHLNRMAMYRKALRADAAMLDRLAQLPANARVAMNVPDQHEAMRNAELVLAYAHNRSDIRFESALTEAYRTRPKVRNDVLVRREFGWMNWLLGGRDLGRVHGYDEAELWLLRDLGDPSWRPVARVHPSPIPFHHHWLLYRRDVQKTLDETYQFDYGWTIYRRN